MSNERFNSYESVVTYYEEKFKNQVNNGISPQVAANRVLDDYGQSLQNLRDLLNEEQLINLHSFLSNLGV